MQHVKTFVGNPIMAAKEFEDWLIKENPKIRIVQVIPSEVSRHYETEKVIQFLVLYEDKRNSLNG